MELVSIKASIPMFWISAVSTAGIAGNLTSWSSWTVLAGVALLPLPVMLWRWNNARQTMFGTLQEARR